MKLAFNFKLSREIRLTDSWPVRVADAIYSFGPSRNKASQVTVTLLKQPVALAPSITNDGVRNTIKLRHRELLPPIIERLDIVQCVMGMLIPLEIDTDNFEVSFEAENTEEQSKIQIPRWEEGRVAPNNKMYFDIAAKGFLSDPWPESERQAAQFYRRARQALDQRYFIDAFVNCYFYLERLYAGGKFKTKEVVDRFASHKDFMQAFFVLSRHEHRDAIKRGAPLEKGLREFCEWIVGRRGFFQHQSDTDPKRWLHSSQEEFSSEAFLMTNFVMSIYYSRNAERVFNDDLNQRWMEAARNSGATMKIVVDIFGDDPAGKAIKHSLRIDGAGTRITPSGAQDILLRCLKVADERLIAIRQMTASVEKTHEIIFSYSGPLTLPDRGE